MTTDSLEAGDEGFILPRLSAVHIEPGDALIFKLPSPVSPSDSAHIQAVLRKIFPGTTVLVLDHGIEFTVVRGFAKDEGK